ncbi:hypothetical protein PCASD_25241 [Puccinia coronata f. sp. avenae]|uniref:Uncharacterized protein n=2 Tax=Puccinia coronata f. sp. avenae TaxID=200324 RepID=A0A2N5SED4_9BASI|nr:hypothetical protein PCASD_25241 [Puccinia coronata f. sp. avenae]
MRCLAETACRYGMLVAQQQLEPVGDFVCQRDPLIHDSLNACRQQFYRIGSDDQLSSSRLRVMSRQVATDGRDSINNLTHPAIELFYALLQSSQAESEPTCRNPPHSFLDLAHCLLQFMTIPAGGCQRNASSSHPLYWPARAAPHRALSPLRNALPSQSINLPSLYLSLLAISFPCLALLSPSVSPSITRSLPPSAPSPTQHH